MITQASHLNLSQDRHFIIFLVKVAVFPDRNLHIMSVFYIFNPSALLIREEVCDGGMGGNNNPVPTVFCQPGDFSEYLVTECLG